MAKGNILFIDDDEDVLFTGALLLRQAGFTVVTQTQPQLATGQIKKNKPDVILLDMNFKSSVNTGNEGLFWLKEILKEIPEANVIPVTAYGDIDLAVTAMKSGAADFVTKPWQNEKLLQTVTSAIKIKKAREVKQNAAGKGGGSSPGLMQLLGKSDAFLKVIETVEKVAPTDAGILILGENGTGKELVAQAIHALSQRKNKAFVSVDLGALSETLFESELFGFKKGAFTDAKENRTGKFESAQGGSLFLDEIGNLPLHLQSKLLAVLQNRQISRIGSEEIINLDIRIISATNANLNQMTASGLFRQDLLYRLNTVTIELPPLRKRKEDIPLLVDHFLQLYTHRYNRSISGVSSRAMDILLHHSWPGNVRELQHMVERAVILAEKEELDVNDFSVEVSEMKEEREQVFNLEEMEKAAVRKALGDFSGNISMAARHLGISRAALYRRMEKYGL